MKRLAKAVLRRIRNLLGGGPQAAVAAQPAAVAQPLPVSQTSVFLNAQAATCDSIAGRAVDLATRARYEGLALRFRQLAR